MKILRSAIIAYIVVVLLSGCGGMTDQSAQLAGTTWRLIAINKHTPIDGTNPTIQFEDGLVSGQASCNSFGGNYQVAGDEIKFDGLFMTEMYCMEPEGAMDQEMEYLGMLGSATRFEINGDQLVIVVGPQQTLTFERQ